MSVWHEVRMEFVGDTLHELIKKHGKTPLNVNLLEILDKASTLVNDLPEKQAKEDVRLLKRGLKLLVEAEAHLPIESEGNPNHVYYPLRKMIKEAKFSIDETIKDILIVEAKRVAVFKDAQPVNKRKSKRTKNKNKK